MSASPKIPGVVTRFAPSPTGFLHIGGARTALFNWLFARHHGGKYLLRIEDTDRARSTQPAIDAILDGLSWLGIEGDEPPVMQFERSARHAEVAAALLTSGHAYRCYLTPEELTARREAAQAERKPFRIVSEWRDRDDGPEGKPFVVRIKAPREGETVIEDLVQGRVAVANGEIDDFVLLRSDGTPTYMLAVVVDDHDMGITHVIRGDDHLTNAARQTQIYQAMGWDVPSMSHIPLIHGADGAKLSKRHGALGVDAYRGMGYLPAALRNYLVRLGWSHGDQEMFTTDEMVAAFSLGSIGRSPARFDFAKLENLNGHYMRGAGDKALLDALKVVLPEIGPERGLGATLPPGLEAQFLQAMPGLKERAKTLIELIDSASYLYSARPLKMEDKAAALLSDETRSHIGALRNELSALAEWGVDNTEQQVRAFADARGLKLGQIAQPLRAALTGKATSPPLFDVMVTLGRDECLARLDDVAIPGAATG